MRFLDFALHFLLLQLFSPRGEFGMACDESVDEICLSKVVFIGGVELSL